MMRWFVMPPVPEQSTTEGWRPKYDTAQDGITGWAGQNVAVDGTEYAVVRLAGTQAGLDAVEANDDAASMDEAGVSESQVAGYLNDRLNRSLTFDEWEARFIAGEVNTS